MSAASWVFSYCLLCPACQCSSSSSTEKGAKKVSWSTLECHGSFWLRDSPSSPLLLTTTSTLLCTYIKNTFLTWYHFPPNLKVWQRPFASATATASVPIPPPDPYNTSNTSSDTTLPPDGSYYHDSYDEQEINCPACILQVTCEIWAQTSSKISLALLHHQIITTKVTFPRVFSINSYGHSFSFKKLLYPINVALHLVLHFVESTLLCCQTKVYEMGMEHFGILGGDGDGFMRLLCLFWNSFRIPYQFSGAVST